MEIFICVVCMQVDIWSLLDINPHQSKKVMHRSVCWTCVLYVWYTMYGIINCIFDTRCMVHTRLKALHLRQTHLCALLLQSTVEHSSSFEIFIFFMKGAIDQEWKLIISYVKSNFESLFFSFRDLSCVVWEIQETIVVEIFFIYSRMKVNWEMFPEKGQKSKKTFSYFNL